MTKADIDAFAKLLGFTLEVKPSPIYEGWIYTVVHEEQIRLVDWANSSKEMAIRRGTKHMREYLIKRFKLGEQHGI